jgi:hypothetical protein
MLYQTGQAILLFGTAMATSGMGSTSQRVRNWMENDANGPDNELLIEWKRHAVLRQQRQSPAHNFAPLTTPTSLQLDDKDYQVPFRFNGKIDKVSVKLGPDQLLPAKRSKLRRAR